MGTDVSGGREANPACLLAQGAVSAACALSGLPGLFQTGLGPSTLPCSWHDLGIGVEGSGCHTMPSALILHLLPSL